MQAANPRPRGSDTARPVDLPGPPGRRTSLVLAGVAALVVGLTYWLAVQPGAADAQAGFVTWVNDPPPLLGAVLEATNWLLRPLPLAVVAAALLTWIMVTARGAARWELVRAGALGVAVAELVTQVLKRVADQPRPTAVIPGLDVHGYPKDPFGNAYPSAHTAVAVALVAALWPWLTRSQRAVGVVVAVLVALNRLYIAAHWPLDVVGGAAVGVFAGCLCWLVAARWPIGARSGAPPAGASTRGTIDQ